MKMHKNFSFIILIFLASTFPQYSSADINLANSPLYIGGNVPPMVMLNISKDHQLFYKLYNDYSDLDGDGATETTYKHDFDYYGYFDSYKCYSHDGSQFNPASISLTKYCSGQWSGNFLNWVTMARIDAVRKLLYGGYRSEDTSTQTVLERSYIPTDAHAWAKYYKGSDISLLTPFDGITTSYLSTTSTTSRPIGTGSKSFTLASASAIKVAVGDQLKVSSTANLVNYMLGYVTGVSGNTVTIQVDTTGVGGSGTLASWKVENLTSPGISFCNLTLGGSGDNGLSQTNTNPPLMRVARGDFRLWAANERFQCYWRNETTSPNRGTGFTDTRNNGNIGSTSGIYASWTEPDQSTQGLSPSDYTVRVKVCDPNLFGTEKCKKYPSGNYKPIGFLQTYGDDGLIEFGLMTGSYTKNKSGGVLRKNIGGLADEVNTNTDGMFKIAPSQGNIINTLNKLKIYGYSYNPGSYEGSTDLCSVVSATTGNANISRSAFIEGRCGNWGNPISEIYLESIRYLAGKSANSAFTYTGSSKDGNLGLPIATWSSPLNQENFCAPLSVLNFNASVSSYDMDQLGSFSDLPGSPAASALTKLVGDGEGISGKQFFIGNNGATDDQVCTAKIVSDLGEISGLCPEAPSLDGGYNIAGMAYYVHTHKIRDNLTVPNSDSNSLKVDTYGISLATNTPNIKIPGTSVKIVPAFRAQDTYNTITGFGSGAIVDFKIVDITSTSGKYYVNWEVQQHGSDYDADGWGIISYSVSGGTITITTDLIADSASGTMGFGYIINGTDQDGVHFHSGKDGFNYPGECNNCTTADGPSSKVYNITSSSTASLLKDPLWYAAKWGGFKEKSDPSNNKPDLSEEWDSKKADGTAGSDGVPDNYFYVVNPSDLEKSLNKTFVQILESSSASSVATNSTSLQSGSRIYQAQFNSNLWSGKLLSFKVSATGQLTTSDPEWDASVILSNQLPGNRQIITYNRDKANASSASIGIPFTWAAINELTDPTQKDALNTNSLEVVDNKGEQRVSYLRGDKTNEGISVTSFRQRYPIERSGAILGDIVNSNPWYVGIPQAGYPDSSYLAFRAAYLNRKPIIYVGANDGMLHGFDASVGTDDKPIANVTGKEVIAYIPGKVYENLSKLTEQNYSHQYYVDGSPMVADAYVGGWKTILVGGLNAGGQGFYALNVTDPTKFDESRAGELVLWEFTDEDDPDLGYTFNQPKRFNDQIPDASQIRKMADGRWAVIVGNGYNNTEKDDNGACEDDNDATPCTYSTTGHAVLYILFLDGGTDGKWSAGTDFIKIDTNVGDLTTPNGLATPFPVDVDGNDIVDYIYAGDLRGNLWKFDVSMADPSKWEIALEGKPLFTAKDAANTPQPITSSPTVTPHPYGGFMVSFGTGKYLEASDVDPDPSLIPPFQVQTLYGVWDKPGTDARSIASRSTLVQQTVIQTVVVNDKTYRITSQEPVTWIADDTHAAKDGWYMDLPNSSNTGERVAYNPLLRFGRFIATTLIPSSTPCKSGGESWVMELDYLTGGRLDSSPFDVNGNGNFNDDQQTITVEGESENVAVGGLLLDIGIAPTPTVIGGGVVPGSTPPQLQEIKIFSGSSGAIQSVKEKVPPGGRGRINWREITND